MSAHVLLIAILLFCLKTRLLTAQESPVLAGPLPCSSLSGVVGSLEDLARSCPELSTFSKLLAEVDGYGKWLLDCGRKCTKLGQLPRTVFVPVDAAWSQYFASTGSSLPALTSRPARKALTALMRYHVLPRVLPSSQVPPCEETEGQQGERLLTLQGDMLLLAKGPGGTALRVTGRQNGAVVLRPDIAIGKPVVHLVNSVLLLDPLPHPPPLPPPPPSPPAPPLPAPLPEGVAPRGATVFNLTWGGRPVDMDLIVVATLPPAGGEPAASRTMFYSYTGPEPLIGNGTLQAYSGGTGALSGFFSQSESAWEALVWTWPDRPAEAVYTICSYFYNLEWYPGTVISEAQPLRPLLTVSTDDGRTAVGSATRPLTRPGAFSFTLLPRDCNTGSLWFLAQVCVDARGRMRLVSGDDRC